MSKSNKKHMSLLLASAFVLCTFSACMSSSQNALSSPGASSLSEDTTWTFTDSAGRQVEIPTHIERVLASGSLAQPFIWPLAADELVSLWDAFSEEDLKFVGQQYADLPVTGSLYRKGSELNVEEVASLNAQIVIDYGEPKDSIKEDLDDLQALLGIPCVFIDGSLKYTPEAYRTLGKILGREEKAEEIAEYAEGILRKADALISKTERKTLVCASGSNGLECIASGSFFDAVWEYMGKNVAVADNAQSYWFSAISMEQLQKWDPEYIFFYTADGYKLSQTEKTWSTLTAVKNGNCFLIPASPVDFCVLPSVNRLIGIEWLVSKMYPDDSNLNIKDEIFRYYKLFYDCDLTDELYNELIGAQLCK
ncbi:MAG: ABC transporter substrate-binding protein [Oscillospiraceae bacterium]|nr:ABC transporter substrate-binding protein [Oscillospiraceae bacterium]